MKNFDDVVLVSQQMTLLYVEDNPQAREMTTMILQEFFGTIITAVDGQTGLEMFEEHAVDMILTDINMPRLTGIEMVRKIREHDANVSVVVLTAHNDEEYLVDSIGVGVDGYLMKPIKVKELFDLIARIVQKYQYQKERTFLHAHHEATDLSAIVSKTDPAGIITYANDAFCDISGYSREELMGKPHSIIRHPDNLPEIYREIWRTIRDEKQVWKGVLRNRAKNGKSFYVDGLIMPVLNARGEIVEYIASRHDITHIMRPSQQLQNALKKFQEQALLYLKMKNFEMLEGFYDTEALEELQINMTHFLQERLSPVYDFDRIYPLGHGEFALLLSHPDYLEQEGNERLIEEIKKIQHTFEEEHLHVRGMQVNTSVMISLVCGDETLILESAKLGIKKLLETHQDFIFANQLAIEEQIRTRKNMQMVSKIKDAILESRVISCFQPIVDNRTRKIVKYESLVRLADGNDEVIAPLGFLDISKKCGCYPQITEMVIQNSFEMLTRTEADISINISVADIEHRPTREMILTFLHENNEQAHRLVFELLEDEMTENYQRIHAFATEVKTLGARIAIDDFGAGYSNYERLLSYRPDILKIDGSLIRTIDQNSYSLSIVKSIVTFAKEQGLETIAEFVEDETTFDLVQNLGIEYSQGYYFGKPQRL